MSLQVSYHLLRGAWHTEARLIVMSALLATMLINTVTACLFLECHRLPEVPIVLFRSALMQPLCQD